MPLPTFVIAGERRSGTTSLARWMECHPDVFLHPALDMAYFVESELVGRVEWLDGEIDPASWDKTHSPEGYAEKFAEGAGKKSIGEKSADYLFWRPSHERLARFLPDAKFIFTLRHPIKRAYSHYWHEVGRGREKLSFEEALAAEDERLRTSAWARDHLSYRTRGFYEESLADFFEHIAPERVLITTVEENAKEPVAALQNVYRFLGVDPNLGLEQAGERYNSSPVMLSKSWAKNPLVAPLVKAYGKGTARIAKQFGKGKEGQQRLRRSLNSVFSESASEVPMSDETRKRLEEVYAPHTEALERLLGRDFSLWKAK